MKHTELITLLLAIIGLCMIFYMNKAEAFQGSGSGGEQAGGDCPPPVPPPVWTEISPVMSIISRYSGVGVDVCSIDSANCDVGNINSKYVVKIKSANNDVPEGVMSVRNDGSFSSEIQTNAPEQLWKIVEITSDDDFGMYSSETPSNTRYPYHLCIKDPVIKAPEGGEFTSTVPNRALQYENGTLSVRFLGDFESQKWLVSQTPVGQNGISIMNSLRSAVFPPEYQRSQGRASGSIQDVSQLNVANQQQVMESLMQIQRMLENRGGTRPPSETTFGDAPISVNLRLGGSVPTITQPQIPTAESGDTENFTSTFRINNLLDRFDNQDENQRDQETLNALISHDSTLECKIPNFDDYVTLDQMASCTACSDL